MLKKVISGGQNGVDVAALRAAKKHGFETGGTMPKGFITLDGPKPEYAKEFGLAENGQKSYPPRTEQNVLDSDATLQLAFDFNSAGEKCTMHYVTKYNKPNFKVRRGMLASDVVTWLTENNVVVLNVAGNSERTAPGIEKHTEHFLGRVFTLLKEKGAKS